MPQNKDEMDIFGLLSEGAVGSERKKNRETLLAPTGVKDIFQEGTISINSYTCIGVQCKACIKVCPTNGLYWGSGKIEIIEDLCVYCGACILNCQVDDCIKLERKRADGKIEKFSKSKDVVLFQKKTNTNKKVQRVQSVVLKPQDYYRQYPRKAKEKQYSATAKMQAVLVVNQTACFIRRTVLNLIFIACYKHNIIGRESKNYKNKEKFKHETCNGVTTRSKSKRFR
jgi:ferredoxin